MTWGSVDLDDSVHRVFKRAGSEFSLMLCGCRECRVKTRSGVRVSGVENQDAARWRLSVELNQKRQVSTVTAFSLRHANTSTVDR